MDKGVIPYSPVFTWGAKALRCVPKGKAVLAAWREACCYGTLKRLHIDVLHEMRKMACYVQDLDADLEEPSATAQAVCTECRQLIGNLLELPSNHLHSCIKVFVETEGRRSDLVATWVRSDPFDDRPALIGATDAQPVRKNTVWAALLGEHDGNRTWRPHRAFGCNDLGQYEGEFRCSRKGWKDYYRSTLAVPIRFPKDPQRCEYEVLGFLTFDSPMAGVFRKIPNIFEYTRQSPAQYSEDLESSMVFHAVGILADTLGTLLRIVKNKAWSEQDNGI